MPQEQGRSVVPINAAFAGQLYHRALLGALAAASIWSSCAIAAAPYVRSGKIGTPLHITATRFNPTVTLDLHGDTTGVSFIWFGPAGLPPFTQTFNVAAPSGRRVYQDWGGFEIPGLNFNPYTA